MAVNKVDKNRLRELLCDNDVDVYANNNVDIYGLVGFINRLKGAEAYIKQLKGKGYSIKTINDSKYISLNDCIDILKKSKLVKCKAIYIQSLKKHTEQYRRSITAEYDIRKSFVRFFKSAGIKYEQCYEFCNEDEDIEYIDFYLPELNMALEIDSVHRTNRDIIADLEKQIYFMKLKKCEFVRVNAADSEESRVELMGRLARAAS